MRLATLQVPTIGVLFMAPSQQFKRKLILSLRKIATVFATAGFFAAALFLAAGLLLPASAAPSSTAMDVEPSLLLALDKPHAPLPKLHLPPVSATPEEERDMMAAIINQDLATELNNWTYTVSVFGHIINGYDGILVNFFSLQISIVRNEIYFYTGLLQSVGLNSLAQQYVAALGFIADALSALFGPAVSPAVSPHS
jgi:hypothetical protein